MDSPSDLVSYKASSLLKYLCTKQAILESRTIDTTQVYGEVAKHLVTSTNPVFIVNALSFFNSVLKCGRQVRI